MFIAKISADAPPAPNLVIGAENNSALSAHGKAFIHQPSPGISLKWQMFPANAGYGVESSTELNSGRWQSVSNRPVYTNGWYHVTLPTTNGVQFFRLRRP
jgi:hypothetical protein